MTNAVNIAQSGSNNQTMRNRIINGAMVFDQRRSGASFSNLVSNEYTLDRWSCYGGVSGRFSIQRSTSSVPGFTNSLLVTSLAATTPGSTDIYILRQYIEGFNTADLAWGTANAQPITVSFWVNSSLTGTFGGVIKNGVENRGYAFTYTINAANTNEYKTITIPGDTTGAWDTDSNCGIQLLFSLGAGSSVLTSPGSWTAGNIWAPSGQSNIVGTNGATWRITGVQFEEGTAASPFEYRLYGTELQLCQRYFQKSYNISVVPATVTSAGRICFGAFNSVNGEFFQLRYPTPLRASPTITTFNPDTGSSNSIRNVSNGTNITGSIQPSGENGFTNLDVALPTGSLYGVQYTASSEL